MPIKTCFIEESNEEEDTVLGTTNDLDVLAFISQKNKLVKFIPKSIGEKLPNLKYFFMNGCSLTIVRDYHFKDMRQLRLLNLDSNRIATIERGSFNDLTRLKTLYLGTNQLETLDEKLFATMTGLQHIDLSFNKLKVLSPRTFPISGGRLSEVLLEGNVCTYINFSTQYSSWRVFNNNLRILCQSSERRRH